jgi:hypothetical protein
MDWFLGGLGLMSGFGYQFQSVRMSPFISIIATLIDITKLRIDRD